MCKDCFEELIYKFNSQENFEKIEAIIQEKFNQKTLLIIDASTDSSLLVDIVYQCCTCNEIWYFSAPDNAWRGYFLPEESAKGHMQILKSSDKKTGRGYLLMLLIVLSIILYNIFK